MRAGRANSPKEDKRGGRYLLAGFVVGAVCTFVFFDQFAEAPEGKRIHEWLINDLEADFAEGANLSVSTSSGQRPLKCSRRSGDGIARLTIRCSDNTTSLSVYFGGCSLPSIVDGGFAVARYWLDAKEPGSVTLSRQGTDTTFGLWQDREAVPFIKSMFGRARMFIGQLPHDRPPLVAQFQIYGLQKAIEPIRKACKW